MKIVWRLAAALAFAAFLTLARYLGGDNDAITLFPWFAGAGVAGVFIAEVVRRKLG